MTLNDMRERVVFQANADIDDLVDYQPAIEGYINDGYDKLLHALLKTRLEEGPFLRLEDDDDEPKLPTWTHSPIADYATFMIYRNGNTQKQSRGMQYWQNFSDCLAECQSLAGRATYDEQTGEISFSRTMPQFKNVYP